ncbi:protein prenylyltransferase [Wolfiporia cocos MD-104 SS10]|uniref:Geranylgeranyl transferase type-2 subunit alpha n=1 Tax=Wolfiporia cocos (strain MD-104) TaxID=742152 RepID=A0A2H3JKL6_WOLCO|nr:protein prenylyltransferase [Wolfiporia cocos MD-104 SS10]
MRTNTRDEARRAGRWLETMHGVKRVRYSREALEAKKQREQAKLKEYLALTENVLQKKKCSDWSKDAFDLTTRILHINPEFYTIWNYRRNILVNGIFPSSSAAEINDLLSTDLSLTTAHLKQHPKVYWIWNHRRWCLANVPDGPTDDDPDSWRKADWNKELYVVEKMLDADARNFHAWNYRRHVLSSMPVKRPEQTELAYTTRKIEANFSNFSAWHQRSKVLMSLWDAGKLDRWHSMEEEFELVKNAMYTDPGDQSVWIYHRWLIGNGDDYEVLCREIAAIQELMDEQPDSKWCVESLVFYKRLLLRNHLQRMSESERTTILDSCSALLKSLQSIDPNRRQRYVDLAFALSPQNNQLSIPSGCVDHSHHVLETDAPGEARYLTLIGRILSPINEMRHRRIGTLRDAVGNILTSSAT